VQKCLIQFLKNKLFILLTFSRRKFEITPPIGSPPRENCISTYFPLKKIQSINNFFFTFFSLTNRLELSLRIVLALPKAFQQQKKNKIKYFYIFYLPLIMDLIVK